MRTMVWLEVQENQKSVICRFSVVVVVKLFYQTSVQTDVIKFEILNLNLGSKFHKVFALFPFSSIIFQ